MTLPRLSLVDERYAVVRVLRTPGLFSRTYLAREVHSEEEVLLIEYFPEGLVRRSEDEPDVQVPDGLRRRLFDYGLGCFVDEHEGLRGLAHANVVAEQDVFKAHGTVYGVQPYEAGASLESVLKQRGALTQESALAVMLPVLSGLEAIHTAGMIHGGLGPAAVHLSEQGRPVLQYLRHAELQLAREMEVLPDVVSHGYAPPEQYLPDFSAGPWVDVYASASLLFRMLSGRSLPDARHRLEHDEVPALVDGLNVGVKLQDALLRALELDPLARTRAVDGWLEEVKAIWQEDRAAVNGSYDSPKTASGAAVEEEGDPEAVSESHDDLVSAEEESDDNVELVDDEEVAAAQDDEGLRSDESGAGEETAEGETLRTDRPPRPTSSPRRPERSSRRYALGIALAMVALLGITYGSTLFVRGDDDRANPLVQQVAFFVSEGDSLRNAGHLEAARQLYRRALDIDPNNEFAAMGLVEVEDGLARKEHRSFRRLIQKGDSLVNRGAALEEAGDVSEARRMLTSANVFFLRALNSRPDDSLVLARVQRVARWTALLQDGGTREDAEEEEEAEQPPANMEVVRLQMFDMLREQGKERLNQGDTAAAERKFREALDVRPDSALQGLLTQIQQVVGQRERREQYEAAVARGRRLLAQQRLVEARLAFETALKLNPDDTTAREQLQHIVRQQEHEQQRVRQFEYLRAQGDVMLQQGDLDEAIAQYREAQRYASTDTALQAAIDSLVSEREALQAQEVLEAQRKDEDGVYRYTDVSPQLVGSRTDLYRRARYPERALRRGIEGRVYVQMVVDVDGSVTEAKVLRGIGGGCDEEALRLFRTATFVPGTIDGDPVKAWHTMFIDFDLPDRGSEE